MKIWGQVYSMQEETTNAKTGVGMSLNVWKRDETREFKIEAESSSHVIGALTRNNVKKGFVGEDRALVF